MRQRLEYPRALQDLIHQLRRLPSVGPRSAERMALWMLTRKDARAADIAQAILATQENIIPCADCGFFAVTPEALCDVCRDPSRLQTVLCVVEQVTDILPLERTGLFNGLYHSLGGRISPLDHIGPDDLRIAELLERIRKHPPEEVILALGADVEGEATAIYLASLLRENDIKVTRLAQGISVGTGLEFADELTLGKAFSGRLII